MYYNSSSKTFRCGVNGSFQDCAQGFDSTNTAAGTTKNGNTAGLQTIASSASIPANYCAQGRNIDIWANGIFSTTTTAQPIAFTMQLGGTTVGVASTAYTPTASLTNAGWNMEFHLICDSAPGASANVNGEGHVEMLPVTTALNSNAAEMIPMYTAGTYAPNTFATNGALTLTLSATFTGTTSASNTITVNQFIVQGQ